MLTTVSWVGPLIDRRRCLPYTSTLRLIYCQQHSTILYRTLQSITGWVALLLLQVIRWEAGVWVPAFSTFVTFPVFSYSFECHIISFRQVAQQVYSFPTSLSVAFRLTVPSTISCSNDSFLAHTLTTHVCVFSLTLCRTSSSLISSCSHQRNYKRDNGR